MSLARRFTAWFVSLLLIVGLAEGVQFAAAKHASRAHADASTGTAGVFVPLQGRVLNTLNGTGGYSSPLTAGTWSSFQVTGSAGVPSTDVSAVQVSVEAISPTTTGTVNLSPDLVTPGTGTMLYYTASQGSVSNTAIVAVGSNGKVKVHVDTTIDVIVDVQGYYTDGSATAAGGFAPVTQKRFANTTTGLDLPAARVTTGQTVNVPIGGLAGSGVPADANAVFVNVQVINYSTTAGYITTYAHGTSRPGVSEDFIKGSTGGVSTSLGVTVPLGSDGSFDLYVNGATVDLLIDVQGYFDGSVTGGAFTPAVARVMDTRVSPNTSIAANATASYQVTGLKGIPVVGSGISSMFVNIQAINSTSNSGGYLRAWASDQAEPGSTANLVYMANAIRSNSLSVQVGADGTIKIHNVASWAMHLVIDVQGWYSNVGEPISNSQSRTQEAVTLQASAGGGGDWVTYKYRVGTSGSFTTVPTTNVVNPGGSTHPSWPVQKNGTTHVFDPWTWDLRDTLNALTSPNPASDTLTQVVACFGSSSTDPSPVCSAPVNMTYSRSAFGDSYANESVGPGSLALLSGDYQVTDSDVSESNLEIGRSFTTLQPINTERTDASGIFGPGWTSSIDNQTVGAAGLSLTDNHTLGYLTFTAPNGGISVFQSVSSTSAYPISFSGVADAATSGDVVVMVDAATVTMTDLEGTTTTWLKAGGIWSAATVVQSGQAGQTSYTRDAAGRVTQIVAPVPVSSSGVPVINCTTSPLTTAGCRSLNLSYSNVAVGTTVVSRLTGVSYTAFDPTSSAMRTINVASYDYDGTGRLNHEWDPRLSPAMKTAYAYDGGGRLNSVTPPGLTSWNFTYDSSGRLSNVSSFDPALSQSSTFTVVYGASSDMTLTGLPDLTGPTASSWGQSTDLPYLFTAIFSPNRIPTSTTPSSVSSGDWPYAVLHYLDANGRETNTASYGAASWQFGAQAFDSNGNESWSLTPRNRMQALAPSADTDSVASALLTSNARAAVLRTDTSYDPLNPGEAISSLGPVHPASTSSGVQHLRSHDLSVYDEGKPDATIYGLVTTTVKSGQDLSGFDYDPITQHLGYAAINVGDASGWVLRQPTTTVTQMGTSPSGSDLVRTVRYNAQGQIIESRLPAGAAGGDARSSLISYYTAGSTGTCISNALVGLPCQTQPAAQPGSGGPLPLTTYTYDIYGEPLVVTQTIGSTHRDYTTTYSGDSHRIASSAVSVTPSSAGGQPTEVVDYGYDPSTGLPISQTTPAATGLSIDTQVSQDSTTATASTPAFSTTAVNETLIAFVSADGPNGLAQTSTVTGAGLTWSLVARSNAQNGDSEIWKASATDTLAGATVSAVESQVGSPYHQTLTVVALKNATVGVSVTGSGASGAPSASLTTTSDRSLVFGVGHDWDGSTARTLASGQMMVHEYVDPAGDDGWVQRTSTPVASSGSVVTTADAAPTTHRWDLAAVEIKDSGLKISTGYDAFGRPTSYVDASGVKSTTSYDIAGRVATKNDGKGTETYTYDTSAEHRNLVTGLDLGVGPAPSSMSATYDADGNFITKTYPNGLVASAKYDNADATTTLSYDKGGSNWLTFNQAFDATGRTASRTGPQSWQAYSYDNSDRLLQVKDTVFGSPTVCSTRVYSYDRDSNRTSLATYPDDGTSPSTGHCSTSTAPTTTTSTYDDADRLTSAGYTYDTFGRTITIPASDANGIGSHTSVVGNLSLGFYANDLIANQAQGSSTQSFTLDPTQSRALSTSTSASTLTNHYSDSGDRPSWTSTTASTFTRNLLGIDGAFVGTVDQAGVATIDLVDMQENVIATAADTTAAAGLTAYFETSEFGIPRVPSAQPDTYGYLGAAQRSTNDLGGLISMGVRLYNPSSGRFASIDPVKGGNDNAYTYPLNPLNQADTTGSACTTLTSKWTDRWGWVRASLELKTTWCWNGRSITSWSSTAKAYSGFMADSIKFINYNHTNYYTVLRGVSNSGLRVGVVAGWGTDTGAKYGSYGQYECITQYLLYNGTWSTRYYSGSYSSVVWWKGVSC